MAGYVQSGFCIYVSLSSNWGEGDTQVTHVQALIGQGNQKEKHYIKKQGVGCTRARRHSLFGLGTGRKFRIP